MQDIVDVAGNLASPASPILTDTRWSNLLYLTIILGIVVEEFILRYHLSNWQYHCLLVCLVDTNGDFRSCQILFYHHFITLEHSLAQGGSQLILVLYFADAKTRSIGSRLHEARHSDALFNLVLTNQILITTADEQRVSNTNTIAAQILVKHKLVESHSLNQYTTSGIGNVYEVEIALQDTILTWSAMNGDIGIVEELGLAVFHKREVIAVDLCRDTTRQFHVPVLTLDIDDIHIVSLFVEERKETLSRTQ